MTTFLIDTTASLLQVDTRENTLNLSLDTGGHGGRKRGEEKKRPKGRKSLLGKHEIMLRNNPKAEKCQE